MTLLAISNPTAANLRGLVQDIADDPSLWRPLVAHGPERHFACLHQDDDVEVWVVSWGPGHDTGFHDHDASGAAIAVVEGEVREQRLTVGRANVDQRFGVGQTVVVRPSDIHRVQHAGDVPSVTIHAYSPPLGRMGQYRVGPSGTLERHAQDAADELKAIAV